MNVDSLVSVKVEYNHPDRNTRVLSVGCLLEGSQHLLLIHGTAEQADQYSYIVIPRDLIVKITELRVPGK
jgi:hypothetical protein